jgi:hypothetical protein
MFQRIINELIIFIEWKQVITVKFHVMMNYIAIHPVVAVPRHFFR